MGLDAYVQCNCIKEGKVKNPPFDMNLIICNDGVYELRDSADDVTFHKYINWLENAFQHPRGYYIYERVSNVGGSNFLSGVIKMLERKACLSLVPYGVQIKYTRIRQRKACWSWSL